MAGVRPLTEAEKEVISLFGKPMTVYHMIQAFKRDKPSLLPRCLSYRIQAKNNGTNPGGVAIYNYMDCNNIILKSEIKRITSCPFCQMKCGSLKGVKHHLTSSHALFDFSFRLSENGHPNFDVSVKPDAFANGVLNYDLEKPHLVDYTYLSKSRKRGQVYGPKGRTFCKIFEKYSDDVPRDEANEMTHENGSNISSSLARTRLSEKTRDIQTMTQPEIGQSSKAKGPRAIGMGRKTLNPRAIGSKKINPRATGRKKSKPQRVKTERWFYTPATLPLVPLKDRQFYHSRTLVPMTHEEVLSDADSEDENDEEFKDLLERMKLDRLEDATDDEKKLMWLWNTFVRKQRVLVDKHMPWACVKFIKVHAKELIARKLVWHWKMFAVDVLCIKYGLISGKTVDNCSIILQNVQEGKESPTAEEVAAAAAEEAVAAEAAKAAKAAKYAAAAAKASNCKPTRKSARIQKKKQEAASTSKANASGNKPQPMQLDDEEEEL